MIVDWDDFGSNHVISDMCQTKDCRDKLDELHYTNGLFKATLFAVPGEMTLELLNWCSENSGWIQLAVHGFYHRNNYECDKMTYDEFDKHMKYFKPMIDRYFTKGFKAPGWQISTDVYQWLLDNGYWVADQGYNDDRRPKGLKAYINHNGNFTPYTGDDSSTLEIVDAWHGHCWNCVGNGIYETIDKLKIIVKEATEFKFISEVL